MRALSPLFASVLAVMASCGSVPDVPGDTEVVGGGTQDERAASPGDPGVEPAGEQAQAEVAAPSGPALPGEELAIGFAARDRFVVFARGSEPSFVVFDRDAGESFRVLGRPMGEAAVPFGGWSELGLAAAAPRLTLVEDGQGRLLVRSEGGVQLVDLAARGRMLAAWRGTPGSASVAPDGGMFAVTTTDAMHLFRAADGAVATYPSPSGEPFAPRWGTRAVSWSSGSALVRVDRATFRARTFPSAPEQETLFASSAEADVVAVAQAGGEGGPGAVTVFVEGEATPIVRVASSVVTELHVDAEGAMVVWLERLSSDSEKGEDRPMLHAVDVATRAHVRFAGLGSGCSIAPESITRVGDGKIVTDASCRIGCPSVRWTDRAITYDAHTGRVLGETSVTEERSYNEAMVEARARVEAAAARLRVEPDAMLQAPSRDALLVADERGLALVDVADRAAAPLELEGSAGASLGALTFSEDGALVAGVVGDRARAWEVATGRALLR